MSVLKSMTVAALSLGLALVGINASAADLSNASGQSCTGDGTWHFVNNQTEGAGAGLLTAIFDTQSYGATGPSKVNSKNQHFYVYTYGVATLLDAYTDLPGKLVLSDFTCDSKEPPPCDPKTDPKCEEPPPCDPKTDPKCQI